MFSQQRLLSWVTVALLTVTLPLLSSCFLLVKGKQPVTITASEKDAEIRADGVYLGQGQATVQLSKGESHAITATKGNRTACAAIDYSISTTGILDAVGGCLLLLPAVGLASDGAWKLDATHIYLKMP